MNPPTLLLAALLPLSMPAGAGEGPLPKEGALVPKSGAAGPEIEVPHPGEVRSVRVTIQSYWALGGGLNEIQVYGRD